MANISYTFNQACNFLNSGTDSSNTSINNTCINATVVKKKPFQTKASQRYVETTFIKNTDMLNKFNNHINGSLSHGVVQIVNNFPTKSKEINEASFDINSGTELNQLIEPDMTNHTVLNQFPNRPLCNNTHNVNRINNLDVCNSESNNLEHETFGSSVCTTLRRSSRIKKLSICNNEKNDILNNTESKNKARGKTNTSLLLVDVKQDSKSKTRSRSLGSLLTSDTQESSPVENKNRRKSIMSQLSVEIPKNFNLQNKETITSKSLLNMVGDSTLGKNRRKSVTTQVPLDSQDGDDLKGDLKNKKCVTSQSPLDNRNNRNGRKTNTCQSLLNKDGDKNSTDSQNKTRSIIPEQLMKIQGDNEVKGCKKKRTQKQKDIPNKQKNLKLNKNEKLKITNMQSDTNFGNYHISKSALHLQGNTKYNQLAKNRKNEVHTKKNTSKQNVKEKTKAKLKIGKDFKKKACTKCNKNPKNNVEEEIKTQGKYFISKKKRNFNIKGIVNKPLNTQIDKNIAVNKNKKQPAFDTQEHLLSKNSLSDGTDSHCSTSINEGSVKKKRGRPRKQTDTLQCYEQNDVGKSEDNKTVNVNIIITKNENVLEESSMQISALKHYTRGSRRNLLSTMNPLENKSNNESNSLVGSCNGDSSITSDNSLLNENSNYGRSSRDAMQSINSDFASTNNNESVAYLNNGTTKKIIKQQKNGIENISNQIQNGEIKLSTPKLKYDKNDVKINMPKHINKTKSNRSFKNSMHNSKNVNCINYATDNSLHSTHCASENKSCHVENSKLVTWKDLINLEKHNLDQSDVSSLIIKNKNDDINVKKMTVSCQNNNDDIINNQTTTEDSNHKFVCVVPEICENILVNEDDNSVDDNHKSPLHKCSQSKICSNINNNKHINDKSIISDCKNVDTISDYEKMNNVESNMVIINDNSKSCINVSIESDHVSSGTNEHRHMDIVNEADIKILPTIEITQTRCVQQYIKHNSCEHDKKLDVLFGNCNENKDMGLDIEVITNNSDVQLISSVPKECIKTQTEIKQPDKNDIEKQSSELIYNQVYPLSNNKSNCMNVNDLMDEINEKTEAEIQLVMNDNQKAHNYMSFKNDHMYTHKILDADVAFDANINRICNSSESDKMHKDVQKTVENYVNWECNPDINKFYNAIIINENEYNKTELNSMYDVDKQTVQEIKDVHRDIKTIVGNCLENCKSISLMESNEMCQKNDENTHIHLEASVKNNTSIDPKKESEQVQEHSKCVYKNNIKNYDHDVNFMKSELTCNKSNENIVNTCTITCDETSKFVINYNEKSCPFIRDKREKISEYKDEKIYRNVELYDINTTNAETVLGVVGDTMHRKNEDAHRNNNFENTSCNSVTSFTPEMSKCKNVHGNEESLIKNNGDTGLASEISKECEKIQNNKKQINGDLESYCIPNTIEYETIAIKNGDVKFMCQKLQENVDISDKNNIENPEHVNIDSIKNFCKNNVDDYDIKNASSSVIMQITENLKEMQESNNCITEGPICFQNLYRVSPDNFNMNSNVELSVTHTEKTPVVLGSNKEIQSDYKSNIKDMTCDKKISSNNNYKNNFSNVDSVISNNSNIALISTEDEHGMLKLNNVSVTNYNEITKNDNNMHINMPLSVTNDSNTKVIPATVMKNQNNSQIETAENKINSECYEYVFSTFDCKKIKDLQKYNNIEDNTHFQVSLGESDNLNPAMPDNLQYIKPVLDSEHFENELAIGTKDIELENNTKYDLTFTNSQNIEDSQKTSRVKQNALKQVCNGVVNRQSENESRFYLENNIQIATFDKTDFMNNNGASDIDKKNNMSQSGNNKDQELFDNNVFKLNNVSIKINADENIETNENGTLNNEGLAATYFNNIKLNESNDHKMCMFSKPIKSNENKISDDLICGVMKNNKSFMSLVEENNAELEDNVITEKRSVQSNIISNLVSSCENDLNNFTTIDSGTDSDLMNKLSVKSQTGVETTETEYVNLANDSLGNLSIKGSKKMGTNGVKRKSRWDCKDVKHTVSVQQNSKCDVICEMRSDDVLKKKNTTVHSDKRFGKVNNQSSNKNNLDKSHSRSNSQSAVIHSKKGDHNLYSSSDKDNKKPQIIHVLSDTNKEVDKNDESKKKRKSEKQIEISRCDKFDKNKKIHENIHSNNDVQNCSIVIEEASHSSNMKLVLDHYKANIDDEVPNKRMKLLVDTECNKIPNENADKPLLLAGNTEESYVCKSELIELPKSQTSQSNDQEPSVNQSIPLIGDNVTEFSVDDVFIDCRTVDNVLASFVQIAENQYHVEKIVCKQAKRVICDCSPTPDEDENGEGCGYDCMNRLVLIECGKRCVLGKRCSNKQFQQRKYIKCEVFKVDKKGFGLRALETVPKGSFIMEYVGEVVDTKEFHRRVMSYSESKSPHHYFMSFQSDCVIDATVKGNISRFINHSCDPNSETQKWSVQGELRIGFFSKKEIKPNEEITFDYQMQNYGRRIQKCYCGTQICRQYIGINKERINTDEPPLPEAKGDRWENVLEDISETGLINRRQTLDLNRVMIYVKSMPARSQILNLIQNASNVCKKLFLDYHGLSLIWSWMVDSGNHIISDDNFRCELLKTLSGLPITNKTVLIDSKVYSVVEYWAAGGCIDKFLSSPTSENVIEVNHDDGQDSLNVENELFVESAKKLLDTWSSLRDTFRIPKKERVEQMKQHEMEADRNSNLVLYEDEPTNKESNGMQTLRHHPLRKWKLQNESDAANNSHYSNYASQGFETVNGNSDVDHSMLNHENLDVSTVLNMLKDIPLPSSVLSQPPPPPPSMDEGVTAVTQYSSLPSYPPPSHVPISSSISNSQSAISTSTHFTEDPVSVPHFPPPVIHYSYPVPQCQTSAPPCSTPAPVPPYAASVSLCSASHLNPSCPNLTQVTSFPAPVPPPTSVPQFTDPTSQCHTAESYQSTSTPGYQPTSSQYSWTSQYPTCPPTPQLAPQYSACPPTPQRMPQYLACPPTPQPTTQYPPCPPTPTSQYPPCPPTPQYPPCPPTPQQMPTYLACPPTPQPTSQYPPCPPTPQPTSQYPPCPPTPQPTHQYSATHQYPAPAQYPATPQYPTTLQYPATPQYSATPQSHYFYPSSSHSLSNPMYYQSRFDSFCGTSQPFAQEFFTSSRRTSKHLKHSSKRSNRTRSKELSKPQSNALFSENIEDIPLPDGTKNKTTPSIGKWRATKDRKGRVYYYHTKNRTVQWNPPTEDQCSSDDSETEFFVTDNESSEESDEDISENVDNDPEAAEFETTSEQEYSKMSDRYNVLVKNGDHGKKLNIFCHGIADCVRSVLKRWHHKDCQRGRITSKADFKYLARKLTRTITEKELQNREPTRNLIISSNVKNKIKDYIKKYMAPFKSVYVRPVNE